MSTPRRDGVRLPVLVAVGGGATVLATAALALWQRAGHALPLVGWLGLVMPLALTVLVLILGHQVRRTVQGRAARPVEPITAARVLLIAQIGALTGAAVAGWYAAQLFLHLRDLDVQTNRAAALVLATQVVAGVALAVAGLVTQRWCRIDDSGRTGPDEQEPVDPVG